MPIFPRSLLHIVDIRTGCRTAASMLIVGAALVATAHAQNRGGMLEDVPDTPGVRQIAPGGGAKRSLLDSDPVPQGNAPIANVYSLQALINFDTLEAAEYDPAKKTLALFGRRARADRLVRIPYLDHLAAALEAGAPTLSLKWTPESAREIEEARKDTQAFFNIYEPGSRRINALGAWLFSQGGVSVAPGTHIDSVGEQVDRKGGLDHIFRSKGPMHVPPDLTRLAFKAAPRARPEVKGMSPRSLMAKVALEADVQSKMIGEMPELKQKISGYQLYSEWERARGDVAGEQHTWISPGRFELQESPDGVSLRFARSPMQFNMQKYDAGKSTPDPILTSYAQLLTRQYDELAVEFPVLHELREIAKIMAVRSWLKRHGWEATFPKEGRADWSPPAEVPGIVHMIVNVKVDSGSRLSIKSVMWQTGGVDLRVDDSANVVKANLGRYSCGAPAGTPFFNQPANPAGASLVCGGGDDPAALQRPQPPAVPSSKPGTVVSPPVVPVLPRNPVSALLVQMAPKPVAQPSRPPTAVSAIPPQVPIPQARPNDLLEEPDPGVTSRTGKKKDCKKLTYPEAKRYVEERVAELKRILVHSGDDAFGVTMAVAVARDHNKCSRKLIATYTGGIPRPAVRALAGLRPDEILVPGSSHHAEQNIVEQIAFGRGWDFKRQPFGATRPMCTKAKRGRGGMCLLAVKRIGAIPVTEQKK